MAATLYLLSVLCVYTLAVHSTSRTHNDIDIDSLDTTWKLKAPTSNGEFINSGTPGGVPLSFDCAVRRYAWEYGKQIQPRHGHFVQLFDALQLSACNVTRPSPKKRSPPKYKTKSASSCVYYIDVNRGSDTNDGSLSSPFQSILKGIEATRSQRKTSPNVACVLQLMEGTYYQSQTIELTPTDSNLTIQNYNGQEVTISGGVPLQFNEPWKLDTYQATQWITYTDWNNVYGLVSDARSNDQTKYLGVAQSYEECVKAAETSTMNPFYSITWNSTAGDCYGMKDTHWAPVQQSGMISGHLEGRNIWSVSVKNTNDLLDGKIYGLRVNRKRAIRARYPNQNPETMMQYAPLSGWISASTQWKPPQTLPDATVITNNASDWPGVIWPMDPPDNTTWDGEGDWGVFWQGKGGHCAGLDPDFGYWCSRDSPRHIQQHQSPSGVYLSPKYMINAPYTDVSEAVVHAWRPAHWYTWMWNAGDYNRDTGELQFSSGGFQGGEGETKGAEWYIENVKEELDAPNEYFYDSSTNTLYFYYNVSTQTAPPSDTEFVAVKTKILFNLTGTQSNSVRNIVFEGLEFRDTPYTYMDTHGLPSGGDWAIQRQGAITFEGTEFCVVKECHLTHLDGIGIFLTGYNRNTTIENNEFSWIGDSAMAAWGYTSGLDELLPGGGPDGRDGNQPRFTMIRNNMVHEIGIWEKQSSMWFQATSAQTRLINNVFFNGPRAAVNVNDGFGGDNHMIGNLLMNTCRESGDHGPWNSWDRVPYITRIRNGLTSSIIPAFQQIAHNFIIGTYQTQEGIDTDDGSSYYNTHDNFFVYGDNGLKNDFGGHTNYHTNNVYAYVNNAWSFCCISGSNDRFINNSVVLKNNGGYNSNCNLPKGTDGMIVQNNSIYNPSGLIMGTGNVCGVSFDEWQAKGNDVGTTIKKVPSDQTIIQMGRQKLDQI
eukprot:10523_1